MDRLKRKIGPLPVWAWLAILTVGLIIWRRRQAAASDAVPVSAPPTPEAGQVLAPGESYYDPNTGELTTAPGGGGSDGTGGGSDPTLTASDIAAAVAAGIAAATPGAGSDPTVPDPSNPGGGSSGGSGGKNTVKAKPATTKQIAAVKARGSGLITRHMPRSSATIRGINGGRTSPVKKPSATLVIKGRVRGTKAPTSSKTRNRPTHAVVGKPTVTQHPASAVAKPKPTPSPPPKQTAKPVTKQAPRKVTPKTKKK